MNRITAKDHLGNLFPSIKQMYEHYKNNPKYKRPVSYSAFIKRLDAGWSIRECLEGRIKKGTTIIYRLKTYNSMTEFCLSQNLDPAVFRRALKRWKVIDVAIRKTIETQKRHNII